LTLVNFPGPLSGVSGLRSPAHRPPLNAEVDRSVPYARIHEEICKPMGVLDSALPSSPPEELVFLLYILPHDSPLPLLRKSMRKARVAFAPSRERARFSLLRSISTSLLLLTGLDVIPPHPKSPNKHPTYLELLINMACAPQVSELPPSAYPPPNPIFKRPYAVSVWLAPMKKSRRFPIPSDDK